MNWNQGQVPFVSQLLFFLYFLQSPSSQLCEPQVHMVKNMTSTAKMQCITAKVMDLKGEVVSLGPISNSQEKTDIILQSLAETRVQGHETGTRLQRITSVTKWISPEGQFLKTKKKKKRARQTAYMASIMLFQLASETENNSHTFTEN